MANLHKSTTITHAPLAASRTSHGLGQLNQGAIKNNTTDRSSPFNAKTPLQQLQKQLRSSPQTWQTHLSHDATGTSQAFSALSAEAGSFLKLTSLTILNWVTNYTKREKEGKDRLCPRIHLKRENVSHCWKFEMFALYFEATIMKTETSKMYNSHHVSIKNCQVLSTY